MSVLTLDFPLLAIGLGILIWARFRRSDRDFQLLALVLGTFFAQITFVVTWTLDRFCLAGSAFLSRSWRRESGLQAYLPFLFYAVGTTLLFSLSWKIPTGVATAYGTARVWVQLVQLVLLALAARAFAVAMREEGAPKQLWIFLRGAGIIHGLASLYQMVAVRLGMPLLGISRPHGLLADPSTRGDIAAFVSGGVEILRPGGLAGEPKAAAVVFGVVLFGILVAGHSLDRSRWERELTLAAAVLSGAGFLLAFSTSAMAGAAVLALLLLPLVPGPVRPRFLKIGASLVLLVGLGWVMLQGGLDLGTILMERTFGRSMDGFDPPVAAAIQAIRGDLVIFLFGTGAGGSSFHIMAYLNEVFEFAYAPNIGIILLLVEFGLVGTFLLLGVFMYQVFNAFKYARRYNNPETLLLVTLSLTTMTLCLTGSGIGIGFPMALGTVAGALKRDGKILVKH